eukprot:CAMPEP_0119281152 /NCGR_PEP_ID=MMETSP1329-20130426/24157_1 /TAXON_ID=114041 /ORGANISM="Genus nov. species nov., Strain RCC1024" /LENGTH=353 /DNA_ID=CAMNT_0007281757 /DNA_START=153 /DNA_END=1211 /DNA_ORIENTATION=-
MPTNRDALLLSAGALLAVVPWRRIASAVAETLRTVASTTQAPRSDEQRVCVFVGTHAGRVHEGVARAVKTSWRLETLAEEDVAAAGPFDAAIIAPSIAPRWREAMASCAGVKLVHLLSAGYEYVQRDALPAGAVVCNSSSMDVPIAEFCVLCALDARIRLRRLDAEMRNAAPLWQPPFYKKDSANYAHAELRGSTVLLVGLGRIGAAIVARLEVFGVELLVARSATSSSELDGYLARADFVIIACALTPATTGLLDSRRFKLMKPTAALVNVARGKVIDEAALFDALEQKRIAHAYIDVWYEYGKGPGSPATPPGAKPWSTLSSDVLTMTQHTSGWTAEQGPRKCEQIADNLD